MVAHSSSAVVCLPAQRGSAKKAVSTRSLAVCPARKAERKGKRKLARYRLSSQTAPAYKIAPSSA